MSEFFDLRRQRDDVVSEYFKALQLKKDHYGIETDAATIIQKGFRCFVCKKRFKQVCFAIRQLERFGRGFLGRSNLFSFTFQILLDFVNRSMVCWVGGVYLSGVDRY